MQPLNSRFRVGSSARVRVFPSSGDQTRFGFSRLPWPCLGHVFFRSLALTSPSGPVQEPHFGRSRACLYAEPPYWSDGHDQSSTVSWALAFPGQFSEPPRPWVNSVDRFFTPGIMFSAAYSRLWFDIFWVLLKLFCFDSFGLAVEGIAANDFQVDFVLPHKLCIIVVTTDWFLKHEHKKHAHLAPKDCLLCRTENFTNEQKSHTIQHYWRPQLCFWCQVQLLGPTENHKPNKKH